RFLSILQTIPLRILISYIHLEDLSNEIFFEIFDYLHALDIFTGFSSLNKRFLSILQTIPLRILISYIHCRRQIDFLSSHLIYHADQVISIGMRDTIRDDTSIISLLFNRHYFINLQSCRFITIHPSTKLDNVIKQIKNFNRLVSFSIYHPNDKTFSKNDKSNFTHTILMHKSSSLRSVVLQYAYDYLDISNYTSLPSNLISLYLYINGSPSTVSVYSILPILRLCHRVRYIRIIIKHNNLAENNNMNFSIRSASINENDLPILPQMISFDLIVFARCDTRSIGYILRCMPNLKYFIFILGPHKSRRLFPSELIDGHVWQQMLELSVPYLSKFEFHMSVCNNSPPIDLDIVIDSFEYFVRKYPNWHMVIDQWKLNSSTRGDYIMLRTLNYHKRKSNLYTNMPLISSGFFETRSTMKTINDHYLFYVNEMDLGIYITPERPTITCSSPLFQQIISIKLEMPIIRSSLWNNLLNIVNFGETNNDDARESVTYLSRFVDLVNITKIEFGLSFNINRWKHVQFILEACPNVVNLTMNTTLLISSRFIDNPLLIPIFKQIKLIETKTEKIYFPSNFPQKLVEYFPSLIHIELQVFSFDNCVSSIETFLSHLKNLSYLKITYYENTSFNDPFSRDYIIEKRRQTFPMNIIYEQIINVKNNGEAIEIWLT
ncbi:unnamed protein product, partial [Rotaria sordida]